MLMLFMQSEVGVERTGHAFFQSFFEIPKTSNFKTQVQLNH